jgi:hypothetical protein
MEAHPGPLTREKTSHLTRVKTAWMPSASVEVLFYTWNSNSEGDQLHRVFVANRWGWRW